MISYNYQWKCWLETSCFTGVQPDARVPNFGSRVLINLREPWHQEGLERLTERMDCNEQARKDSFASHKQLNGCDLSPSLKWVQDSRYFTYLYFKYNSNCTNTLLYDAMLTFEITLMRSFGKRRTSWAFPPQDRHWCPIGGSQDWRVQWNGTRAPGVRALVICYMKLHLHLQDNSMLHHVVTPCFQESERERESWSMLQLARLGRT
jgi:hypothetical protein